MTDIIVDGQTAVWFVPTAANSAAITTAEITAGKALHDLLVPTGLEGFEPSTAEIDNTALSSKQDSKVPGRGSYSGTGLVLKKQTGTDAVFNLLSVFGTTGFIVIRDGIDAATAAAAAQKYEAYPITTGYYGYVGRGEANSLLRYRVPTPVSGPRVVGTIA